MIEILLKGFEFGIVLTFLIGPVFFAILQASIEHGFWVGVLMAIGVSLSDILYVVICYFGLSTFMENPDIRMYMGYVGGVILIGFGLHNLLVKAKRVVTRPDAIESPRPSTYILKGFLINGMSPMVPIFWIASVSIATLDFGYTSISDFGLFFGGVLVTVLATDIGKAYLSGKLTRLVTPRSLRILNLVLGVVFIFFGVRLIYLAIQSTTV